MKITKTEAFEVLIQLMSNEHNSWESDNRELCKRHTDKVVSEADDFLEVIKGHYKDYKFKEEIKDRERRAKLRAKRDQELNEWEITND